MSTQDIRATQRAVAPGLCDEINTHLAQLHIASNVATGLGWGMSHAPRLAPLVLVPRAAGGSV
eukprot:2215271-Prymnesium_polylepis.1